MNTFANRNNQAGSAQPSAPGANAMSGAYNNMGPEANNVPGGGMNGPYDQGGTGAMGGQDYYPPNQRDFPSGGTADPGFNNNAVSGNHPNMTGHHHKAGIGGGNQAGNYTTGAGGPGVGTAGGHGIGGYGTGGQGNGVQGTGGQALTPAAARTTDGASAGEKELVGKVERVAGNILCSDTLKAKGIEKERQAQALKVQAAEVGHAENLESEAAARRQRAVAHGAHPHHLGANTAGRI